MANVRLGSVVADIRGSIGDETYGRNTGGIFVRSRVTPADPPSAAKTKARNAFAACAAYWSGTLSEAQREGWRLYGRQHLIPGKFGVPRVSSGFHRFIAHNVRRYMHASAVGFPNAPPYPPLWKIGFTFHTHYATDAIHLTQPFINYEGPRPYTSYYVFSGMPVSRGRSFYAGPWRYVDYNHFTTGWYKIPWNITCPWDIVTGGRIFCRLFAQDKTNGQMSAVGQAQYDT